MTFPTGSYKHTGFLKDLFLPLLVFAPKKRAYGRDWNMTLLAIALFGYLLSSVRSYSLRSIHPRFNYMR